MRLDRKFRSFDYVFNTLNRVFFDIIFIQRLFILFLNESQM